MEKMLAIIDSMAETRCTEVLCNDSLPSGHNGPYHDQETPVRIAAHWIVIFRYEFEKTKNSKYKDAMKSLADYICSVQLNNGTFHCRNKAGKDSVNGTIGAAWVIEGLIEAAKVLHEDKYYHVAEEAFLAFPFDNNLCLWKVRDISGEVKSFDSTYNHQLWFAAAGALICSYKKNDVIEKCVQDFLSGSKNTFHVYKNGLIFHFVYYKKPLVNMIKTVKICCKQYVLRVLHKPSYQYKEEGYHNFSVYAFAILHRYFSDHDFFNTDQFKKAVAYSLDIHNSIALATGDHKLDETGLAQKSKSECNIYGFSYNSPAFELPLIVKEFSDRDYHDELSSLEDMQIKLTYDADKKSFCRNTEDSITLDARIYEYVRALMDL